MTSIVRQVSMKNRKRVQHFKKLLCDADNVAVIALYEKNQCCRIFDLLTWSYDSYPWRYVLSASCTIEVINRWFV